MRTLSRFAVTILLAWIAIPLFADDPTYQYFYVRSDVNQPWGQSTNEDAMDNVFGADNWTTVFYETMNVNDVFNPATRFIFLEGGDSSFTAFQTFMQTNGNLVYTWIWNGGKLLIMSAPNDPLSSATLYLPDNIVLHSDAFYGSAASSASAVSASYWIFNHPNPVSNRYSGDFVAHGYFTGNAVQALMTSNLNQTVLGQDTIGWGLMVFGGLTTDNFHSPQPDGHLFLQNILTYTSSYNSW